MAPAPPIAVRVAQEHERREALALALRPLAPAARGPLLDAVGAGGPHPLGALDALVVAVSGERVEAATWAQPAPGRAAALWPPEWADKRPRHASDFEQKLVTLASSACDTARVGLTQALFETADDPRVPALEAAGYYRIAELEYLGRTVPASPPNEDDGLEYEPYSAALHERMKRLLSRTYVESLDCPGLDDLRDLEDVIAGYRATGRHDPRHWLLASRDGVDVAALLLAEHPDADQAELIYMGVTPEARGRGFGALLIDKALRTASQMGADQLMVAVDRANTPAHKLYERAGFAGWAQRWVYVRARGGRR